MGWTTGDVKTIFVQGIIPLVVGIGLCCLGCLYLFGILKFSCKRHDDQVAPLGSREGNEEEEGVLTPEAAEKRYGPVACAAQLYGMQQKERQAVLEKIFSDCCTHIESSQAFKERESEEQQDEELVGDVVNVDIDTRCACAICLREYEDTDDVLTGASCNHMFHKSCALLWLTNYRKPKDHCPYCRKEMMTAVQMKKAALDVLGEERVQELSQFPVPSINNIATTTSTMSSGNNSTNMAEGGSPNVAVPDIENGIQE